MTSWLEDGELRIGLGCMRLSAPGVEPERARETIAAALDAGITVFDTARAYGENEALVASVLASHAAGRRARVVTKAGMARPDGGWRPDGRAAAIRRDCEASLEILGRIDLLLLHAPDPRTPWKTSVRALRRLVDDGLVPRVGVSNVNRKRLDEALGEAPISAVEIELSPFEDEAILGGVVARAIERGLWVLAHSPLGGPERAGRLDRDDALRTIGERLGVSTHVTALAGISAIADRVVPIPGATRPETARAAASAARLALAEDDRRALRTRFRAASLEPRSAHATSDREVVLVAGVPGAGKTTVSADLVARGFERLSRDERGGSLRQLSRALDRMLAAGAERVLLDATYVTRASRREVIEVAWRHPVRVRCVYLDTPIPQAQTNVVLRMLGVHGRLLEAHEMEAGRGPDTLSPRHFYRMVRVLEPPQPDEGFSAIDVVPFVRRMPPGERGARFVARAAVADETGAIRACAAEAIGEGPAFLYGWGPGADVDAIERAVSAAFPGARIAWCRHEGGPPICWCRPPLPGLPLALAHTERIDLARSVVVGVDSVDRRLADAIGIPFVTVR